MSGPKQGSGVYVSFFSYLDFTLRVTTTDSRLSRLIGGYCSGDIKMKACRNVSRADINISVSKVNRLPVVPESFRPAGRVRAAESCLQCYEDGASQIYVLEGYAYMLAQLNRGEFKFFLKKMKYSGSFIKNALILFFKSKGFFALHSALVTRKKTGILLSGNNGSGKTTLAMGLSRTGFTLECDDLCLVGKGKGKGNVLAAGLSGNIQDMDKGKLSLKKASQALCSPRWIVFLRLSGLKNTRIRPLGAAEALSRLMEQSLLTCFEDCAQLTRHVQLLKKLAVQCRSFELSASPNRQEVCRSFARFFAQANA